MKLLMILAALLATQSVFAVDAQYCESLGKKLVKGYSYERVTKTGKKTITVKPYCRKVKEKKK